MNSTGPPDDECTPRHETIVWFVAIMGYGDDLLYWADILAGFLRYFPKSRFFDGAPSDRPIPGTDRFVEGLNWRHLNLGSRRGTYDRKLMVVSPLSLLKIRKLQPKVIVIGEFALASLLVTTVRRMFRGCRLMLLVESDPVRGRPERLTKFKRAIRKYVVRRVDLILTNNAGGQQHLINDLGVPADKICVQPFLVSDQTRSTDVDPPTLPAELEADRSHTIFLYVGQLIERKGVMQLIEAIDRMDQSARERSRFWLIGGGDQESDVRDEVSRRGLDEQVRVLGKQPYEQLPAFYQAASVFVLPTLDDYRALVGFEALGHGLPVLDSIYDGAVSEVVDEGRNGFAFDPLDAAGFAEVLERCVSNDVDLSAFGQRSREMSERYTLEKRSPQSSGGRWPVPGWMIRLMTRAVYSKGSAMANHSLASTE